nr:DUF3307 domain-containing protein [Cucumibacter marinus]
MDGTGKQKTGMLLAHVVVVVATAIIVTGSLAPLPLLALGASHAIIDAIKARREDSFAAFMLDQAAHVAVLFVIAWFVPALYAAGWWGSPPVAIADTMPSPAGVLRALTLIGGLLLTLRVGAFAIGKFMDRFDPGPLQDATGTTPREDDGLPGGGLYIGYLERTLIFILVLAGELAAIGFLVAAKSVLRFGEAQKRRSSEYIIIGTLASFAWALAAALATRWLLERFG